MNKNVKRVLISLGSAIGGTVLTLLLRREEQPAAQSKAEAVQAPKATVKPDGIRSVVIELVSDILAETYRKVKAGPREER